MAVDYFLKLDGIKGESSDHKHKEEIQLQSFSWGVTNTSVQSHGSGGGAGKASFQDFHTVQLVSKASPELMLACANGKHIKDGLLTCRKAGENQVEYVKVKMYDLMVTSMQSGGSHGNEDHATEQTSFSFSKIEFEYQEQGADGKAKGGPVKQGWDLKANKKV